MSTFKLKEDLTWRDFIVRAAIILGTVAVIVWAMPRDNRNNFTLDIGKPWKYIDFRAPFDFPIYKSETVIKQERDSIMRIYEPYYVYNKDVEGNMVRAFVSDYSKGVPDLPDDYISIIANRLRRIYRRGIVSQEADGLTATDTSRTIRVVNGKNATSVKAVEVLTTKEAYEQLFSDELMEQHKQALQRCNLNNYITPNLIYDKERSETSLDDLLKSIPTANGVVQKGQKIIDRGEIVDEATYRILESFKKENDIRSQDTNNSRITLAGEGIYVLIYLVCFTVYLSLFRKDYFEKPRSIAMLYSMIVIFALLTSLLVRNTIGHVYIIPYAMVPIFIRIFMDSRTAFITHLTMILICAAMLQHPFDFVVTETVAGLVAIYSLRELQYRSQLFKTAIIVVLTSMAINMGYELMNGAALATLDLSTYNYFIANGLLLLFAYPLLYLIEKTFGFTSDITLIELSNTNNPLLRRLSEVAPGTFQHSIQVGNLAAEIANKIGAKSQLVRTGALYHDIGKMANPIYYTENQSGIDPHANLTCIESAQIIISHVTEGLKMADKYNLPDVIKGFISTHHGQGKTKYFFVKYKNEHPDEAVDDLLFTYPGPNPFTKEQAILMMADTVEAASRSQHDYSEKSIRDLVNQLIDGQLADGFFKECPITFRDIAYAKTVLIEKLKTIYHTRVSYPTPNK
jgi:cyclic-di-AMP phosphodiesterase PgpH